MEEEQRLEQRLLALARNLWWTWHPEIIQVWRRIDPKLWRESRHSPIAFMRGLDRERLKELSQDPALRIQIHRVFSDLNRYLASKEETWGSLQAGPLRARPVAYFCAEFGLHESLPLYSGGLGVLAGDHLKSASDLGIPMVGVTLFYREGYFRQRLATSSGKQIADYERVDPEDLPMTRVVDHDGRPLTIELPIQGEIVQVGAWTAELGRVVLYFLDMESAFRDMGFQELGLRLYGGDEAVRFAQEMILGIGGMRLLHRLAITPGVIHLNEGHSAFATLELARQLMEEDGLTFAAAREQARSRTVFTTHTPVAAGHDRFSSALTGHMASAYLRTLGIAHEELMDLGRMEPGKGDEPFCMTILALRMAGKANGVSSIHGQISRQMWQGLAPDRCCRQLTIGHITNGINCLGWLAPSMKQLFNRYFPPRWEQEISEKSMWQHIGSIPDEELWNTVLLLKARLLNFLPRVPHRAHPGEVSLDPQVLTIGFARRFAAYKRATLLLAEPERLIRLLSDARRPVQIIFSGKAHPRDEAGKRMIEEVYAFVTDRRVAGRAAFIEDYDINVCRHLVQGVDLWLNTPRLGNEASGTSGMKVALNGGLNLSILDGWWPEAYDGTNGFAIRGSRHADPAIQDQRDRIALFSALESEIVPMYYDQDENGVPRRWTGRMRQAMCSLGWRFSSDRMLKDYATHCYQPAAGISSCEMKFPFI